MNQDEDHGLHKALEPRRSLGDRTWILDSAIFARQKDVIEITFFPNCDFSKKKTF